MPDAKSIYGKKGRRTSTAARARSAIGRRAAQTGLGRIGWEQVLNQRTPHPARATKPDPISGRGISERGMKSYMAPAQKRSSPLRYKNPAPLKRYKSKIATSDSGSGGLLGKLAGQMLSSAGR